MKSQTKQLAKALEAQDGLARESVFPTNLLVGLRLALEAGMSCEQITAFLVLMTGLYEILDDMEGAELVTRCTSIMEVVRGDQSLKYTRRFFAKGESNEE